MFDHPMPQRRNRRSPLSWLTLAGFVACGVAGGVVEFLALQRSRVQHRPPRSKAAWHR